MINLSTYRRNRMKLTGINDPRWGATHLLALYTMLRDEYNEVVISANEIYSIVNITPLKLLEWHKELFDFINVKRINKINGSTFLIRLFYSSADSVHIEPIALPPIRIKPRNPTRPRLSLVGAINSYTKRLGLPCTLTTEDWLLALDYWHHACAICERPRGLWHIIAMDHWIPVSDPRSDNPGTVPENILPLCHGIDGCNNSKGNRDASTWLSEKIGTVKAQRKMKQIIEYFNIVKR